MQRVFIPRSFAFTIHGLWPQRKDGSWPEYCDPNHPLRESDIKELVPKLEASWPSWEGEDVWFWSHEWSRHGTCAAAAVGDSYHFFKNVLKLHKHLSVEVSGCQGCWWCELVYARVVLWHCCLLGCLRCVYDRQAATSGTTTNYT